MKMETDKIKIEIVRFYNGETSDEEEQFLFDYFVSGDVDPELIGEREYFLRMRSVRIPDTLCLGIDHVFEEIKKKEKKSHRRVPVWLRMATVAALLAMTFLITYNFIEENDKSMVVSSISEEDQKALVEGLEDLSLNWEKGLDHMEEISLCMEQVNEMIVKQ